jgi:hypothetical protein
LDAKQEVTCVPSANKEVDLLLAAIAVTVTLLHVVPFCVVKVKMLDALGLVPDRKVGILVAGMADGEDMELRSLKKYAEV